ncbi:MAG: helix-turn-helix domain-containing protein, partial [Pirellulales bacterium]
VKTVCHGKVRGKRFSPLRPKIVSSDAALRRSLAVAGKESLWISYAADLTASLLRSVSWPARNLGVAVLSHAVSPATLPALASCFRRFAYAANDGFLPPNELAAVLENKNSGDLFIGGNVDSASQTMTLWRGDLQPLTVPFAAFETSGDDTKPDFERFSVADFGQTVRLGDYEAASDAILYEFNRDYRRRLSARRFERERSFGASLRRLRKQRGLRRDDFAPAVAAKTIARIEQGKVQRIRKRTLETIARRLHVKPEDIETY